MQRAAGKNELLPRLFQYLTTIHPCPLKKRKAGDMSIVTWVIFGLIPDFLAGALAEHYRQTARAKASYSK
jgi:hypothetical protein